MNELSPQVYNAAITEIQRLGKDSTDLTEGMIFSMVQKLPEDIDIETLKYNVSYWVQALIKKPSTRLRFDDLKQILYPRQSVAIPFVGPHIFGSDLINNCTKILPPSFLTRYLIENLGDITKQTSELLNEISKLLQTKNVVILSNHASWLNLPLIAILLQTVGKISPERIYTLLGPAITTRELSYAGIANFSHLIKTVPDTHNGNIELPEVISNIRRNMMRQVKTLFRNEASVGNVFLIAPSGTTDSFDEKGYFHLQRPSAGTEKFLISLASREYNHFVTLGVNDKKVMPDNASLKRGSVDIGQGSIIQGKDALLKALESLPSNVLNKKGQIIGLWRDK